MTKEVKDFLQSIKSVKLTKVLKKEVYEWQYSADDYYFTGIDNNNKLFIKKMSSIYYNDSKGAEFFIFDKLKNKRISNLWRISNDLYKFDEFKNWKKTYYALERIEWNTWIIRKL